MSGLGMSALASHEPSSIEESSIDSADEPHDGEVDPHFQDSAEEKGDVAVAEPAASCLMDKVISAKFKETRSEQWKSWCSKFKLLEMDHGERSFFEKTRARLQILVNSGSTSKAAAMLSNVKRGPRSVKFIRGAGPLYDTLLECLAQKVINDFDVIQGSS